MSTPESTPPTDVMDTFAVGVKLPEFWGRNPRLWFLQAESQFATRGISSEKTKFHHVVAVLPFEVASEVEDIISNPGGYDALKEALIARLGDTDSKRVHDLLNAAELGDRRPTQLLRHMRSLTGNNTTDASILEQLFLQRPPSSVQQVLAAAPAGTTLESLAALADKVMEVSHQTQQPPTVAAASPTNLANTDELASLRSELSQLRLEVRQLRDRSRCCHHSHKRGRSSSHGRHRAQTPTRLKNEPTDGICHFHKRFGDKAYKCQKPCTYQESSGN